MRRSRSFSVVMPAGSVDRRERTMSLTSRKPTMSAMPPWWRKRGRERKRVRGRLHSRTATGDWPLAR